MILVALDPGKTTGFALLNTETYNLEVYEMYSPEELGTALLVSSPIDRIIYEGFQQRNKPAELISRNVIGVVDKFASDFNVISFQQSSSVGKTFWTNAKLKAVGAYTKRKQHGRDATRHLLYYLTFNLKDNYYLSKLKDA